MNWPSLSDGVDKFVLSLALVFLVLTGYLGWEGLAKDRELSLRRATAEAELEASKVAWKGELDRVKVELETIDKLVKNGLAPVELRKEAQVSSWKRKEEEYARMLKAEREIVGMRAGERVLTMRNVVSFILWLLPGAFFLYSFRKLGPRLAADERCARLLTLAQTAEVLSKLGPEGERILSLLENGGPDQVRTAVKPEPGPPKNS